MQPGFESRIIERPGVPRSLWNAPRERFGDRDLSIQVCTKRFRLEGIAAEIFPHLDRLKMGDSEISADTVVSIPVWRSSVPQFNNFQISGREYMIDFDVREEEIFFHGYYFAACFDRKTRLFDLFLAEARPEVLGVELENFFRIASSLYLQFEDIFLFHSSAVSLKGRTFVFFGPQNAGKSTIALLAPEDSLILGDDLNALLKEPEHVWIASVPFPSEVTAIRPVVKRPVTAMFRLVKDSRFSFEPMTFSKKFAALYGSMPVLNKIPDCLPTVRKSIEEIIERVPICSVHFSKDREIYPWIIENQNSIPR